MNITSLCSNIIFSTERSLNTQTMTQMMQLSLEHNSYSLKEILLSKDCKNLTSFPYYKIILYASRVSWVAGADSYIKNNLKKDHGQIRFHRIGT